MSSVSQAGIDGFIDALWLEDGLAHGTKVSVVRWLLGRTDMSTARIYSHVARERLKSLQAESHPRG